MPGKEQIHCENLVYSGTKTKDKANEKNHEKKVETELQQQITKLFEMNTKTNERMRRYDEMDANFREAQGELKLAKDKLARNNEVYARTCKEYAAVLQDWRKFRWSIIKDLEDFVDVLETTKNDTNIAELSGSVISLVGRAITVVGLIATPLTLGAAAPLCFAGAAIAGTGTVIGGGALIAGWKISDKKNTVVESKLHADQKLTSHLLILDEKRAVVAECAVNLENEYNSCIDTIKDRYPLEWERWEKEHGSFVPKTVIRSNQFTLQRLIRTINRPLSYVVRAGGVVPTIVLAQGTASTKSGTGVAQAGGTAAKAATKVGPLATAGAKAVYTFAWVGVGLSTVVDLYVMIDKSIQIDRYNTKKRRQKNVKGTHCATSDEDEEGTLADDVKEVLTDPALNMTISERAEKVREHIKILKQEVMTVERDETIKLLLKEYGQ